MRGTRQGTERIDAHESEVARSFQIHKSLPWGYVGEFLQRGTTNTLLKTTDLLPAAGGLAQPPPIVLAGKAPCSPQHSAPIPARRNGVVCRWRAAGSSCRGRVTVWRGAAGARAGRGHCCIPGEPARCRGRQRRCVPGGAVSGVGGTSKETPLKLLG